MTQDSRHITLDQISNNSENLEKLDLDKLHLDLDSKKLDLYLDGCQRFSLPKLEFSDK